MDNISLCKHEEINYLQKFIDCKWRKNHILAKNIALMDFQHRSKENYTFVIANKNNTNSYSAILGFIPLSNFDSNLEEFRDFWLAIWKVDKAIATPGIGVMLLQFFEREFTPNSIGALGINHEVKKLYKAFQYKTGKLTQYYYLNPNVINYRIAKVFEKLEKKEINTSVYRIERIIDLETFSDFKHQYQPSKSIEYIRNRYLHHPIYTYQLYGIFFKTKIECIFVTRKITINGSACIRIIDVYGDLRDLGGIETELDKLITKENAEYIDCLNFGISQETFLNMGFSIRENIIIPNHFEPFEQTNVDIEFAFSSKRDEYVIFKGDSDQDRPNFIV